MKTVFFLALSSAFIILILFACELLYPPVYYGKLIVSGGSSAGGGGPQAVYVSLSGSPANSGLSKDSPLNSLPLAVQAAVLNGINQVQVTVGFYLPPSNLSNDHGLVMTGIRDLKITGGYSGDFSSRIGVTFLDMAQSGKAVWMTSCENILLEHFVITNCKSDGVEDYNGLFLENCTNCVLSECDFVSNAYGGDNQFVVKILGGLSNAVIKTMIHEQLYTAVYISGSGHRLIDCNIGGNNASGSLYPVTMLIENPTNILVQGNSFYSSLGGKSNKIEIGGIPASYHPVIFLSNNILLEAGQSGIYENVPLSNHILSGNHIGGFDGNLYYDTANGMLTNIDWVNDTNMTGAADEWPMGINVYF